MRPEDLTSFFEAALDKIQPKTEEDRQRIEKLRKALSSIHTQMVAETEKFRTEMQEQRAKRPDFSDLKAASEERGRLARETLEGLIVEFNDQSELISRIATN